MPRLLLPALTFVGALALYAASLQANTFSDGLHLSHMVLGGPAPYYNALYLPLGWAVHALGDAALGWDVRTSLGVLSAASAALGVALVGDLVRTETRSAGLGAAWAVVVALTPGAWFFATTVEVHGLQLLGAALGLRLAAAAREREGARRALLLGGAVLAACGTHLTSVLLLPGLLVWARPAGERGFARRGLARDLAVVAAVAVALGLAASASARELDAQRARNSPGTMLRVFGEAFLGRLARGRIFSAGESWEYLTEELFLPASLLALAALLPLLPIAVGRPAPRAAILRALVAITPYLVVFPQGGVREEGAYYLSIYPVLAVLGAASLAALPPRAAAAAAATFLAVAVPVEVAGALAKRAEHARGPDALEWVARVRRACPPGSRVLTASLPRWHALHYGGGGLVGEDLARALELVPASRRRARADEELMHVGTALLEDVAVFVDADLLDPERAPAAVAPFLDAVREAPVRLEPVRAPEGAAVIVYRFVLEGSDG